MEISRRGFNLVAAASPIVGIIPTEGAPPPDTVYSFEEIHLRDNQIPEFPLDFLPDKEVRRQFFMWIEWAFPPLRPARITTYWSKINIDLFTPTEDIGYYMSGLLNQAYEHKAYDKLRAKNNKIIVYRGGKIGLVIL